MVCLQRTACLSVALTTAMMTTLTSATTIATATFDTDSYIPFKTNNPTASEITVGREVAGYNFNFGVIEFSDLSAVSSSGSKFLVVDLEAFVTLVGGEFGPPTPTFTTTGNSTLKVVALGSSYNGDYALPATVASTWYETNIGGVSPLSTATVTSAGPVYFDVTTAVDAWLANPSTNFGFGLVVTDGQNVELGASSDFLASGSIAPTLSSVPEPTSIALLAIGAAAVLRRRR